MGEDIIGQLRTVIGEAIDERLRPLTTAEAPAAPVSHRTPADLGMDRGCAGARHIMAEAARKKFGIPAREWALQIWGRDVTEALAIGTTTVSGGGAVVPPSFSAEIIELLRPASVILRAGPNRIGMPGGTITIPKMTAGSSAQYIGENVNIGATQPTYGNVVGTSKKLAAIVPVSNEWLDRSVPGADAMLRDDVVASLAQRADLEFLTGNGTQYTPKGLKYWVTAGNEFAANATFNQANALLDLGYAQQLLEEDNVRMLRPAWFFSPRTRYALAVLYSTNGVPVFPEMGAGRLLGIPYYVSNQISSREGVGTDESQIFLVDMADVVVAEEGTLSIDTSAEAAYQNAEGTLVSAFSSDQTVVRVIHKHDLIVRHAESIVRIHTVKWDVH